MSKIKAGDEVELDNIDGRAAVVRIYRNACDDGHSARVKWPNGREAVVDVDRLELVHPCGHVHPSGVACELKSEGWKDAARILEERSPEEFGERSSDPVHRTPEGDGFVAAMAERRRAEDAVCTCGESTEFGLVGQTVHCVDAPCYQDEPSPAGETTARTLLARGTRVRSNQSPVGSDTGTVHHSVVQAGVPRSFVKWDTGGSGFPLWYDSALLDVSFNDEPEERKPTIGTMSRREASLIAEFGPPISTLNQKAARVGTLYHRLRNGLALPPTGVLSGDLQRSVEEDIVELRELLK